MPLQTRTITGQHAGPHLLITGGVHGDEFEPMAAIRALMTEVDASVLHGQVTLVPVVNEPAYCRGHRAGEDGLDLARTCPGKADGSPTERIASEFSELIRSADLFIDLHTGGTRLMVWPLSGYMLHRDPVILEQQRRMSRAFGLPLIWGTDYRLNGRSLSVARDAGVPAIYTEYEGGGRCNPQGVAAYIRGCLSVMAEFEMLPRKHFYDNPAEHFIEDDRPNSGHLQLNHPAPCDGYFEPAVKLGDYVREGDVIGRLLDVLGDRVELIHAKYAGRIIVLHTFPRIEAGVSVAVVLEMPVG